ncbi:hypothetical protein [Actinoplanes sp. NPDC051411]|uniref:hypothetical protein n=1 Tax=Actinoplanes sp. NPDC051411 TaxID=3155522 RepID=UPI003420D0EB
MPDDRQAELRPADLASSPWPGRDLPTEDAVSEDDPPTALDGTPIDVAVASNAVGVGLNDLYKRHWNTVVRSLTTGARPVRAAAADAEDAAGEAFGVLLESAAQHPHRWLETAYVVSEATAFAEWRATAQKILWATERRLRNERRAAASVDVSGDDPGGPAPPDRSNEVPAALQWAADSGIDLDDLFGDGQLAGPGDAVDQLILLRWWAGRELSAIADEVSALVGTGIDAGDLLVRMVRKFRAAPRSWLYAVAYCNRRWAPERTLPDALTADVWRDPFHPERRDTHVTLLIGWMAAGRRLERDAYRSDGWAAQDSRTIVARRIATGLTGARRTLRRQRFWGQPEPFSAISGSLPSGRRVSADTVRKHFSRLRADNHWIEPLLPLPVLVGDADEGDPGESRPGPRPVSPMKR